MVSMSHYPIKKIRSSEQRCAECIEGAILSYHISPAHRLSSHPHLIGPRTKRAYMHATSGHTSHVCVSIWTSMRHLACCRHNDCRSENTNVWHLCIYSSFTSLFNKVLTFNHASTPVDHNITVRLLSMTSIKSAFHPTSF